MGKNASNSELFLENNNKYLGYLLRFRFIRLLFRLNPRICRYYSEYKAEDNPEKKNNLCAKVLDAYQELLLWRIRIWFRNVIEDVAVLFRQFGKRKTLDYSKKNQKDYYSIAVIVKNEARYIEEFILFYQATGADRIYIYDNESDDNLLEVLDPYIKNGFVVYRFWPGQKVHTAAYRDAVRRTKRRTKWLALVDADEFLFSPDEQTNLVLKKYEEYPGIGVNWVMFGPNGHMKRPEGLVMDNYTTTLEEKNALYNCLTKSVVQPKRVLCVSHTHYAIYKRKRFPVDTCKNPIDNTNAFIEKAGRAFTSENRRDVLRINHYRTKSLEELEEKCSRGYADGSPKAGYQRLLQLYDAPLVEDHSIKPYADIVREKLGIGE